MDITQVTAVYFSPAGSTKTVTKAVAEKLAPAFGQLDLTSQSTQQESRTFASDELVIFGVPVYGGRIPAVVAKRFQNLTGSQTPAILLAVYGNREYEDALLELQNTVAAKGFVPIAAASFIAEHSIMHSVAAGRPDKADRQLIADFGQKAKAKLTALTEITAAKPLALKGNFPYREYNGVPLKPKAGGKCIRCGLCAKHCPVGAISAADPKQTDHSRCISCMGCLAICPQKARHLNKFKHFIAEKSFRKKCSIRKEPEFFF